MSSRSDFKQGVFHFHASVDYSKDDFILSDCNHEAYKALLNENDLRHPFLLLQGQKGSGKSHLASLWQTRQKAIRLTHKQILTNSPYDILQENTYFVLDPFPEYLTREIEEHFFHLYNIAQEFGKTLLLILQQSLSFYAFGLKDLESRMKASPLFTIQGPDDQILKFLLMKQLSDRQIILDTQALEFLLKRIERSFDTIPKLVAQIDRQSLESQRKVTIPLLKEIVETLELDPNKD